TFSPNGQLLAVAHVDGAVTVWDVAVNVWDDAKRRPWRRLCAHQPVNGVAFHPDGQRLASASDDRVELWDLGTGEEPTHLCPEANPTVLPPPLSPINAVEFSPDGSLVTGGDDLMVNVTKVDALETPSRPGNEQGPSPWLREYGGHHDPATTVVF